MLQGTNYFNHHIYSFQFNSFPFPVFEFTLYMLNNFINVTLFSGLILYSLLFGTIWSVYLFCPIFFNFFASNVYFFIFSIFLRLVPVFLSFPFSLFFSVLPLDFISIRELIYAQSPVQGFAQDSFGSLPGSAL